MKKNLILLLFFSFGLFSCKKYLDKKSDTSLVVPTALKDLQGLLDDFYIMNSQTPALGEASSDDYFVLPSSYSSFGEISRNIYTWQLKKYTFGNDWNNSYAAIYNTNYCLEQIDKIPLTTQNEKSWNNIKGSAYFFRAFHFLNLAWIYAKAYDETTASEDMGIVLRLSSDFNKPSFRANVRDSYTQIISDLNEACKYLPDHPYLHIAQPSRAASYGLLARTYLSMGKYDSAYRYADLSLTLKHDLLDYNSPEVGSGNVPFQPFNNEIVFYSLQSSNYTPKWPPVAKIDSVLYSEYNTDDLRTTKYFRLSEGYWRFKGSYASSTTELFSGLAVDEILLMRAECYARAGNVDKAMEDLNLLLSNRWVTGTFTPLQAGSSNEVLDIILKERRKELLMRGIRWMDIKRLNREERGIELRRRIDGTDYTLVPNSAYYALPLPQDIIDLTGMPQN